MTACTGGDAALTLSHRCSRRSGDVVASVAVHRLVDVLYDCWRLMDCIAVAAKLLSVVVHRWALGLRTVRRCVVRRQQARPPACHGLESVLEL